MDWLLSDVNWAAAFTPDMPLIEIFVRGTAVYLALFLLLRLVLRRQLGTVGVNDLLVVVMIADAVQNAMAGDSHSVPDGIFLVMTIIFWDFALDWLGYHVPLIGRFIHPPPLPLIADGKLLYRNMRRELITKAELMSQLHEQGVEKLSDVKKAFMEGDGHISILRADGGECRQPEKPVY